jgi:hypothetical protein
MKRFHAGPQLRRQFVVAALLATLTLAMSVVTAGRARAGIAPQATIVASDIASNTTWAAIGNPYLVTAPISVTSVATLTIEPGVEVRFAAGAGLHILGGLDARGTPAQQVRMSGDNGAIWQGLDIIQPTGNIQLKSITIRNAAVGLAIHQPAIPATKTVGRVDLLESLLDGNQVGVDADYSVLTNAPRLTLRNNLLINNGIGLRMNGLPNGNLKPKLNHNSFVGNSIGLSALNISGKGLNAEQQWWGSPAGPLVDQTACINPPAPGTSTRDLVCGNVDFTLWSIVPAGRMIVPAGQSATLESALGQGALSEDDLAPTSVMTLTVPSGAFTQTVDLSASASAIQLAPPGQPTQLAFELTAAAGGQEIHRFANGRQLELEISYLSQDVSGADPRKLVLFYYDELASRWRTTGITTTPDPANQRIIARLTHLTRFRVTSVNPDDISYVFIALLRR